MPKRSKSHQLEDISITEFNSVLPQEWVFRKKEKDYGIDGEVEIFDDKENATGLLFLVQLKATESKKESTIHNYSFKIDSILYFRSLQIPILLARYSHSDKKFFYKWAHEVDLFYAKSNAKTIRVNFPKEREWKNDTPKNITKYLSKIRRYKSGAFSFPFTVYIDIAEKPNKEISNVILKERLRSALKSYNDIVTIVNNPIESDVQLYLSNKMFVISFSDVTGCKFHNVHERPSKSFIQDLAEDTLLGIAVSLWQLGFIDICGRLIFDYSLGDRLFKRKEICTHLIPELLDSSFFDQMLAAIIRHEERERDERIEIIAQSYWLKKGKNLSEKRINKIEEYLLKKISTAKVNEDNLETGIYCYNLGNFYRSNNKDRKAIEYYLLARKYAPIYLNQVYFWGELAGILFDIGKYKYSARFYSKAIEMGAPKRVQALYADALLFSGDFMNAKNKFQTYLENNKDAPAEWHLKFICIDMLLKKHDKMPDKRNVQDALKLSDVTNINDDDLLVEKLQKSLNEDLLCSSAWFNLGIYHNQQQDNLNAFFCFTMCGLIDRWDVKTWVNAVLCSFDKSIPIHMVPLVIEAAFDLNGDNFIRKLLEEMNQNLAFDEKEQLLKMLDEIFDEIRDKKNKNTSNSLPTIRLLNEEGKFENIFGNMEA